MSFNESDSNEENSKKCQLCAKVVNQIIAVWTFQKRKSKLDYKKKN